MQDFERHRVRTAVMCHIKFAVAVIHTVIKGHMVIIVISMKSNIESVEEKAVSLLSVAPGLLSLSDHSVVHILVSFQDWKIKSTRRRACFLAEPDFLVTIYSHSTFTSMVSVYSHSKCKSTPKRHFAANRTSIVRFGQSAGTPAGICSSPLYVSKSGHLRIISHMPTIQPIPPLMIANGAPNNCATTPASTSPNCGPP